MSAKNVMQVKPLRFFETFLIILFAVALLLIVFLAGPPFEQRVFPVLDARIDRLEEQGDKLKFYIEGTKLRGCQLSEASFAWRFDHTIMAAAISDENGQPRPAAPIVQSGQEFSAGPFFALIPTAARLAGNMLRISRTYYYRCHDLWTTEADLEAAVDLSPPPPPPGTPPQTPTVRIIPNPN